MPEPSTPDGAPAGRKPVARKARPEPTRTLTGRLVKPPTEPTVESAGRRSTAGSSGTKATTAPPTGTAAAADPHAAVVLPPPSIGPAGPELARAVLDAARARRAPTRRSSSGVGSGRRLQGYSGPGPDSRDPMPLNVALAGLLKSRGWQRPAAEARLFGMWDVVVGPELAAHSRPVTLTEGVLTVEAESTAWATQIKLLTGKLMVRIADGVGSGVVKQLVVHGPVAPSWVNGPRRVRGRGPRDTYG